MKFRQLDTEYTGFFTKSHYQNNGNTAIQLKSWEEDGGYWCPHSTLSINLDAELPPKEFVVKNYSECAGLPEQFLKMGYFEDTGKRVSFGHCTDVPIYRITEKFLAEVGIVPEPPTN